MPRNRTLSIALLALAGMGWTGQVPAQAMQAQPRLGAEWVAIEPARLDDYRGGYDLPSGILLSFGIERVVFVNGELVSALRINVPDIGAMTAAQAQDLAKINQTQLVQIGPGNVFQGLGNGGLVIQNTLDGQEIRAQTTINAGVDTLGLFQALNMGDALHNASFATRGPP
jgi:hypothetical protein